jgi:integrase
MEESQVDHIEKTNPSNQNPLQTNLETTKPQESFRQNPYFAEKILSSDSIFPPLSDDHDIRKISREKVEDLLFAQKQDLVIIEDNVKERPGPHGLVQWVWDNKVLKEIKPEILLEYMRKKMYYLPLTYFSTFIAMLKMQQLVADYHQIECVQVRESHLLNPATIRQLLKQMGGHGVAKPILNYLIGESKEAGLLNGNLPVTGPNRNQKQLHPRIMDFRKHMQKKGFTRGHIQQYGACVHQFFSWLCANIGDFSDLDPHQVPVVQINNSQLLAFRTNLLMQVKDGSLSPVTFSYYISAIRCFYYFLQENFGYTPPLRRFNAIKAPRYKSRELPTEKQIETFFLTVDQYSHNPVLDHIGYRLLLDLGLRLMEAAQVTWGDINLGTRTILIRSKGHKSHVLPLAGSLYQYIKKAYCHQCPNELLLGHKPSSIEFKLYKNFKLYAMVSGWPFPGGVHFFRHIFITRLSNKGVLPQVLKELARVVNLDTVSLYMHLGLHDRHLSDQINMLEYN